MRGTDFTWFGVEGGWTPWPMSSWAGVASAALGAVAAAWYVAIWSVCLLGWSVAYKLFGNPWPRPPVDSEQSEEAQVPGVSILRPLAGLDSNLHTNLSSSFEMAYPLSRFEVILSVATENDQALRVARQVAAQYPHVQSTIMVGDAEAGVNPKVNNLVRPYAAAQHDIVWVVDSQVWLPPNALARAVDALHTAPPVPAPALLGRSPHGERVGMVHHVPLGVLPANTWASHVERVFLSTTHAKMYLAINAVAIDSCVMGKSNMYRRSDLERVPDSFFGRAQQGMIGSRAFETHGDRVDDVVQGSARPLARFGIYLAEDNMLAMSLWRQPLQLAHRIAPGDVAHVAVGDIKTLGEYSRRRMRWIRVRRHMVPAATYLEPFTESLVAGVCGWIAVYEWILKPWFGALYGSAFRVAFVIFMTLHLVAWYHVDVGVLTSLRCGEPLPDVERRFFFGAWVLRELLALPIWVWAMSGSTVTWRNQRYRILSDARAAPAEGDASAPLMSD